MENRPIPTAPDFENLMTRGEMIAAAIYLPLHVLGVPLALNWLAGLVPAIAQMSNAELNILYYSVGFVYMLLFLHRFLRRGFDTALDAKGRFVLSIIGGYAADLALSFILSSLRLIFGLELGNSPNNMAITSELSTDYGRIAVLSIALAPIVEEPLFRGLIFGGIRPKSRVLAYIVSAALFSLYHVWQYVALTGDFSLLIYCLLYVPVSVGLAWAYDRSGSIWSPMVMHAVVNAVSLSVLQSGALGV
jgi:membrane protease YdiL (CAAX protease family)